MKRFIAIPFLVLYLVAVSGAMVQIHFCGSKVSSWAVNEKRKSCCCDSGGMNEKSAEGLSVNADNDCCKDKIITLKIAQDQQHATGAQLQLQDLQIAYLPQLFFSTPVVSLPIQNEEPAYQANAPPGRWQNIPLYKLHSRFTYYG